MNHALVLYLPIVSFFLFFSLISVIRCARDLFPVSFVIPLFCVFGSF